MAKLRIRGLAAAPHQITILTHDSNSRGARSAPSGTIALDLSNQLAQLIVWTLIVSR
jgi:hypothetical protein